MMASTFGSCGTMINIRTSKRLKKSHFLCSTVSAGLCDYAGYCRMQYAVHYAASCRQQSEVRRHFISHFMILLFVLRYVLYEMQYAGSRIFFFALKFEGCKLFLALKALTNDL
jgi:hypothetical protein